MKSLAVRPPLIMAKFARLTEHRFVCRVVSGHKWERVQTPQEEAYRCVRCGRRHYGKLSVSSWAPFTGGGGGDAGGGFGGGTGG
jgi:hypothetical protein